MYRILIVEDIEKVLAQIKAYLQEAFAEGVVRIHSACSVGQAHRAIDEAYERRKPYDAIVLDFLLPKETGDHPDIDESLCLKVRKLMPGTLVAHLTAFQDDETVRSHLRIVHQEQVDPHAFALSKSDTDYAVRLERKIKGYLYGTAIQEQLDSLFGRRSAPLFPTAKARSSTRRGERSLTHTLASLSREIELHWHDLDDQLQARIMNVFRVDAKSDPVRVSLMHKTEKEE